MEKNFLWYRPQMVHIGLMAASVFMVGCTMARNPEMYAYPDSRTYSDLVRPVPERPGQANEVVTLSNHHGTAKVSLVGANVFSYVPAGGEEVFFSMKAPDFREVEFQHVGVPVVWPWFNRNGEAGSVQHGFARLMTWRIVSKEESKHVSRLVLGLDSSDETRRLWPYDFHLRYTITLCEQLQLSLSTENTGTMPFLLTEGFHPYFSVSDVEKSVVRGLDGCMCATGCETPDAEWTGDLRFRAGQDCVFTPGKGEYVLFDDVRKRAVCIAARGHRKLILWSISHEEQDRFKGLSGEDWKHYACVEPAVIWRESAITVQPGKRHDLQMSIKAVSFEN